MDIQFVSSFSTTDSVLQHKWTAAETQGVLYAIHTHTEKRLFTAIKL